MCSCALHDACALFIVCVLVTTSKGIGIWLTLAGRGVCHGPSRRGVMSGLCMLTNFVHVDQPEDTPAARLFLLQLVHWQSYS
jgi:hypothetical protein